MDFVVEFVERRARPQALGVADVKLLLVQINRHRIWRIGLDFQRMGTSPGSGLDDFKCPLKRLIMITGHFGDDKRRSGATSRDTPR